MNTGIKNRRQFLKFGASTAGVFLLTKPVAKAFAGACAEITPPQTPGPFYPGETNFHPDTDLTFIPGNAARAQGQVIYVHGRVLDSACQPVPGAHVEIWQACSTGRYDNPNDPNPAPMDPNFKYWGETQTGPNGEYVFKTIIPGAYPADTNWMRPPHIHFKVSALGFHELITQMYFEGNQYNAADEILNAVPAKERPSVIVEFEPSAPNLEPGSLSGEFDITIQKVRRNL